MEAGARSFLTGLHEGYPKEKIAKLTQTLSVEETALTDLSVAKLSGVDNERTVPFCTERLLKERGIDSEELVCPDASSRHSLGWSVVLVRLGLTRVKQLLDVAKRDGCPSDILECHLHHLWLARLSVETV